jgi:hypothetical protein
MGKKERRRRVTREEKEKKLDGSFVCQSRVDRNGFFFSSSFFIDRTYKKKENDAIDSLYKLILPLFLLYTRAHYKKKTREHIA